MALVKQCDRCGKFYKNYSSGYNTIKEFKTNCCKEAVENSFGRTYDLCRECMEDFEEFMSNGGKSND